MEEGIDNNLEASDESLDRYSGDFNTPDLQMQQYEVSPQSQYLMIGNVDKLVTPPRDLNLRNSNRLYCNLQLSDYQKSFNSQLKQAQSILTKESMDKNQPGISQGLMTAGISIKGNKEQQISKMESIVSQLKQQEQKQPFIENLLDFLDDGAKNPSY
ncbi:UNKNOWN [Stylonychia lemnae]|uniref:Uncharacterized protein n=1 Tax=Stylonychia lemnae TaxID=5949 RepID=A0A078AWS6_STYLE|nr:UNKNOWN [Stylonychia lemnae]|eukprot:CDW86506.1 UNKNOWN [Stylonychia lemnae]